MTKVCIFIFSKKYIVRTCALSPSFDHFIAKSVESRGIFKLKAPLKWLQSMRMRC